MTMLSLMRSQLNDRMNDFPFHSERTEDYDCNVAQTSICVELVTGAQLSAERVRELGGDLDGPTGDALAAQTFLKSGLKPEQDFQIFWKGVPTQKVRDLLRAGWYVVLYVEYSVLNGLSPETSGQKSFGGYHAIGLRGLWRRGGLKTHKHDSLNDGRKPGAPAGPLTVPFSAIREAAWSYAVKAEKAGQDTVFGYAVKPKG